ncbi:ribonuclease domain-containing protein [Nocardia alni]|uniref:ribonuclease domain-containing protein n=1 Tax=Nocardia alni TaxID=2815723 RepID=UPI0020B3AE67|nr:ribonuclease domain-containing protein [Nocardia alni]
MRDAILSKPVRHNLIAALTASSLAALTAMTVLLTGPGETGTHSALSATAQSATEIRPLACSVPGQAWQTLKLIDAGQWPPHDGSGTKGGTTWTDREGTLPHNAHYLEWDVNIKQPGHTRDAERIITGDNGTAYYTGDHYATFCQMR